MVASICISPVDPWGQRAAEWEAPSGGRGWYEAGAHAW